MPYSEKENHMLFGAEHLIFDVYQKNTQKLQSEQVVLFQID